MLLGLLLLAGLAGCSARGDSPAATAATGSQDTAAVVREWVRCMRDHGLTDFPDPKADGVFRLAGTNARRDLRAGRHQAATSRRASDALEACGFNGPLRGRVLLDIG